MANWSDLPPDILSLFAKRLTCEEFVRFGAVCRSWRDAAVQAKKGRRFSPWMMLSQLDNDDAADPRGVRTFYDLWTGKFYDLRLPQLQGRKCWGTKYGWLITFGLDKEILLFNPLTQEKICLPSQLESDPEPELFLDPINNCRNYIKTIAISSDPSDHSIGSPTVMASFGSSGKLGFASPGDRTWTITTTPTSIADIIFSEGNFNSVDSVGSLSVISLNTAAPQATEIAPPPGPEECEQFGGFYLVEISGSLYLINRSYYEDWGEVDSDDDEYYETLRFYAFKLNFHERKWIFQKHLQGYALFVGNNQSFAISPLDYPEFKPNCFYYTDDFREVLESDRLDMGMYDYVNDTIIKSFDDCGRLPSSELSGSVFFMPQLS